MQKLLAFSNGIFRDLKLFFFFFKLEFNIVYKVLNDFLVRPNIYIQFTYYVVLVNFLARK